jgi:hypothetical protein
MALKFDPEAFYPIGEIEQAGLASRHVIRRWIRAGKIDASKVGRTYVISGAELLRILETGTKAESKKSARRGNDNEPNHNRKRYLRPSGRR